MFRSVFSIVAVASLLVVFASSSSLAQTRAPSGAAVKAAPGAVININTATVAELDTLPGIGARTAALIVEYRQKNGPFKKIEDLMNVRGIGEKNFLKLKPQLTVGAVKADHDRPNQ
ncbi:MAG TPA: helix-hairpin-helix domain-containing protein [Vicinamibacterales bacterium]|nr:helix-hairpin-helix domain-containing protein [Vicinamibacterales bacterium]